MFKLLKVSGDSLTPVYQEGDFVLVAKIPFFFGRLKPGDVVAFTHPIYATMIKQVERVETESNQLYVVGTHANSVDSRQFGAIHKSALLGKVIWYIKKPKKR